jgi:hypothetical protein
MLLPGKTFIMQVIRSIQNRIYEIRGQRVMLDFDLAALYEVETRVLNQSVKRNMQRFPDDFMFQLKHGEFEQLRFQVDALNKGMSSQFVMTYPSKRPGTALPYPKLCETCSFVVVLSRLWLKKLIYKWIL